MYLYSLSLRELSRFSKPVILKRHIFFSSEICFSKNQINESSIFFWCFVRAFILERILEKYHPTLPLCNLWPKNWPLHHQLHVSSLIALIKQRKESREVHQQSFFLSEENEWFLTLVLLWAIQTKNAFPHGYSSPDFVAHSQRWLSYFRHNSCNDIKYVVKNTFTQPLETQASCHHYHSVWKSQKKSRLGTFLHFKIRIFQISSIFAQRNTALSSLLTILIWDFLSNFQTLCWCTESLIKRRRNDRWKPEKK